MSRFFIRRPIVAIVIAIVTVLGGLVALNDLPSPSSRQIVPPQITVTAQYPGADAVTIEQSVATPLEQQMNGVDDMIYMQSTNANDGTMALTVSFDVDTDPSIDQVNVQNRMAQAQPNLPPEVSQFGLTMRKQTGLPMLIVSLMSPNKTYDALFLANYANINILDALYRVPGVGEARIFGAGDYSMRIWVKPDLLARLGLTVPDVRNAIQQQSTVNPSGQVGANPAPSGQDMTYTVRSQGRLQTEAEFGAIAIRSNPDGSVIRLRDVARVELGALNYQQIGRVNGQPGCAIAVFQAPGSNALQVAEGVRQQMALLESRFPADLRFEYTLDTTRAVSEGIREILITLAEAMVLVVLVVYLFLQNWRATLIPVVAVPVSLIGTFMIFPALGFSVNTLSLFGLVLAIGLVVDDAIVVVEAVEHHIEEGMAPKDATIRAMDEVSGPVVSIALILAAVFIPVAFMGGIQGSLNKQFAITIAISVLISAFNALTLSPALAAMWLRPRKEGRFLGRFFHLFNRGFDKASNGYITVSRALIRKAAIGLAAARWLHGAGRRARPAAAHELRAGRGLRLLPAERRAAQCRVAPADRRRLPQGRGHPVEDRRPRRIQRDHRVQPADPRHRAEQRLLFRRAEAVERAPRGHGRALDRQPAQRDSSARRFPRRRSWRSCRRRFPAWVPRAGSPSCCRIGPADRSPTSTPISRSSWPRRASGRSWPASTRRSAPRCRRSSSTSIGTRCSRKASR